MKQAHAVADWLPGRRVQRMCRRHTAWIRAVSTWHCAAAFHLQTGNGIGPPGASRGRTGPVGFPVSYWVQNLHWDCPNWASMKVGHLCQSAWPWAARQLRRQWGLPRWLSGLRGPREPLSQKGQFWIRLGGSLRASSSTSPSVHREPVSVFVSLPPSGSPSQPEGELGGHQYQ